MKVILLTFYEKITLVHTFKATFISHNPEIILRSILQKVWCLQSLVTIKSLITSR